MSASTNGGTHDLVAHDQHPELLPPGPNGQEKRRQDAIKKLEANRLRSHPVEQLNDEVEQEEQRLKEIIGERPGIKSLAKLCIKAHWKMQGIWRDEFEAHAPEKCKWKHEDSPVGKFGEGELDASRPIYRFFDQMWWERVTRLAPTNIKLSPENPSEDPIERLRASYRALAVEIRKNRSQPPPDMDTEAYHRVRSRWQNKGIWDDAWSMMPGDLWKHERPLEELIREAGLEEPSQPESLKGADSPASTFGSVSYESTGTDPSMRI